ncbi:hypothetical protein BUALT_Bualt14G0102200 [Buddleja alternifolia]|uniref:Uncharacterized protein n=1 Tax=Buddleja alternifolia TaxID=168488 RepID=A0AAV6WIH4_9LAMI|nr:hypothetical protein BUALT_Bualt14G0102200 [Buddleja alternifolia]
MRAGAPRVEAQCTCRLFRRFPPAALPRVHLNWWLFSSVWWVSPVILRSPNSSTAPVFDQNDGYSGEFSSGYGGGYSDGSSGGYGGYSGGYSDGYSSRGRGGERGGWSYRGSGYGSGHGRRRGGGGRGFGLEGWKSARGVVGTKNSWELVLVCFGLLASAGLFISCVCGQALIQMFVL